MENEEEIYRKSVEIRKKKLLERGNSRLRLLCPGHEELKNASANETKGTNVKGLPENCNKDGFSSVLNEDFCVNVGTFIKFMNDDASKVRKIIPFIIGLILFYLHNYISREINIYGYYPSNTSGLILFAFFQLLVIKFSLIKYFQLNLKAIQKEKVKLHHIFISYDPVKANYIDLLSDIFQLAIAIRNVVSEWFILLSTYVAINSISNLFV
ncbi:hypothetical protein FG386_002332 [Cryptosporidium ryanae]|uniref:uncharacterized protein n=1 Tax=Cryptosporidium ryanae TaxID=515981 RepID=UPI00351A2A67|nr:hypothetical protein FG386_002332 [Cryptosporidium ryanae]